VIQTRRLWMCCGCPTEMSWTRVAGEICSPIQYACRTAGHSTARFCLSRVFMDRRDQSWASSHGQGPGQATCMFRRRRDMFYSGSGYRDRRFISDRSTKIVIEILWIDRGKWVIVWAKYNWRPYNWRAGRRNASICPWTPCERN
jgi:hypothetical protein